MTRKSIILLSSVLVMTLLLSAAAAFVAFRPSGTGTAATLDTMANCAVNNAGNCVSEGALEIAKAQGPAAGLKAVRILLDSRPDLQQGCHAVAHAVGNAFYDAYGDEAIVPGNEWCSWGYYHGLMQRYGETDLEGVVDYSLNLCGAITPTPTMDCVHGVGHAAYANLDDVARSLTICEKLTGDFALTCADGVIMEDIFASGNGRMRTAFSPKDCLAYTNADVVTGCARGMASEMTQRGASLEESCNAFTPATREKCADGYGSSLGGNLLSGSSGGASAGQLADCNTSNSCAAGFGWIAFMYTVNLERSQAACRDNFDGGAEQSCLTSANAASQRETLR